MMIVERIADGRRRFFPAIGTVEGVFLRDKRGHHDRGLEPGRDYEVESKGVALRRVPSTGETVVIWISERQVDSGRTTQRQEVPAAVGMPAERVVERVVPVVTERVVEIPREVVTERIVERVTPVSVEEISSESNTAGGDSLHALKRALVMSIGETNDKVTGRTAEWQDELAKRTAALWAARTLDDVKVAFLAVEAFLRGGA